MNTKQLLKILESHGWQPVKPLQVRNLQGDLTMLDDLRVANLLFDIEKLANKDICFCDKYHQ